jgi:Na+/H+ antiporter NhaC
MHALVLVAMLACPPPESLDRFEVEAVRSYQVGDLPIDLVVTAVDRDGKTVADYCGAAQLTGLARPEVAGLTPVAQTPPFQAGVARLEGVVLIAPEVGVSAGSARGRYVPDLRHLPGVLSILPPLFAILIAIAFRQALVALLGGIWLGALLIHDFNPFTALLRTFDTYLPRTFVDPGHAAILLFTVALGGMVGVLSRSGGTRSLVDIVSRRARTRRSGMVATWVAGLVVFFDDYANCVLVGGTLRPLTDRLRISREKLAYIVDSTAAPVATVALVSTWIGYQVGLLDDLFGNGYDLFLDILPYSFYSFFTIAFVFGLAVTQRDFGPMLRAERRAVGGEVLRPGAQPLMDRELTEVDASEAADGSWINAVLPIASVILFVVVGLYLSGRYNVSDPDAGMREIISAADSYAVLLWASFGASLVAVVTVRVTRALRFTQALEAWVTGAKSMLIAIMILVLAWAIGAICQEHLQTGPWVLSQVRPDPQWLPLITFLACAFIAFATGTSFSTMAIVLPIAGPMAWALTGDASGLDPGVVSSIRHATLSAVLGGSVFGDHCSPISDTTIMSSMASASDHVDHVRTQLPYAVVCALATALVGYIPAGFGVSPWVSLPIGLLAVAGVIFALGRRPDPAG